MIDVTLMKTTYILTYLKLKSRKRFFFFIIIILFSLYDSFVIIILFIFYRLWYLVYIKPTAASRDLSLVQSQTSQAFGKILCLFPFIPLCFTFVLFLFILY
jgi:hypothetical protein